MKEYSIYNAKARLSELLRFVRSTGPVIITDRGVPVAKVVPIEKENKKGSLKERIELLREMGLLIPATKPASAIKPIAKKPGALKRFLESRD